MNLIIDIGNTVAKLAVFDQGEPLEVVRCSNQTLESLPMLCKKYPIEKGILASVITPSCMVKELLGRLDFPVMKLTHETPIPIKNLYKTPETLGADRLAAVVGANGIKPNHDLLIIDAGTCITFDFIDKHGQYHGGNISPGMEMRLKALHTFTNKLPEVQAEGDLPTYGQTTETAIRSGVYQGIAFEIAGYIRQLKKIYPQLLVFLTGGDKFSFDTNLKSSIFADSFLVLKGLNRILEYNDKI
ncbi:MAG: type III pantothenate kinase [Bacteroidaceae bacterium]|nr:type III pantothenate kinase [Bacteroidaceae bacterium]